MDYITWLTTALAADPTKSKSGLAAAIGRGRSTVSDILAGRRPLKLHEVPLAAQYLGSEPPSLVPIATFDEGQLITKVQLKGCINPDVWSSVNETAEAEQFIIEMPIVSEFPSSSLRASRLVGDSMDKIYPTQTIIVWVEHQPTDPLINLKRYVVESMRMGGAETSISVRTYIENEKGKWLVFESTNPEWSTPIKLDGPSPAKIIGRVVRSIRDE